MSAKKKPAPPVPIIEDPDSHEIDELKALERSEGNALVRARVEFMIGRAQSELETDLDPTQTAAKRGRIRALREVLTIPQVLIGEIQIRLPKEARK